MDESLDSKKTSDKAWQTERKTTESHSREGLETSQDHSQSKDSGKKRIHTYSKCMHLCYYFYLLIMQTHKYKKVTRENGKV